MTAENSEGKRRYRIFVNGQEHHVDQPVLRGVEIWARFDVDPHMELVVEGGGFDGADLVLQAESVLQLDEDQPLHVFSMPPTMFG